MLPCRKYYAIRKYRGLTLIFILETLAELAAQDLLARPLKNGEDSARGPVVSMSDAFPLAALQDGAKLHIVGSGDGQLVAGLTPEQLVGLLTRSGLDGRIRLKQIHLIAESSGAGGASSFAAQLDKALRHAGLHVAEIKAPLGHVRCDSAGKIWIGSSEGWLPSTADMNQYIGPDIQEKHRTA